MADRRPDAVVMAAAKVGGIRANDRFPADFLYDNIAVQTNLIEGAFRSDVGKFLFLGFVPASIRNSHRSRFPRTPC